MRSRFLIPAFLLLALGLSSSSGIATAAEKKKSDLTFLNVKEAGADYQIQGEYTSASDKDKLGAQVIALGGGTFEAHLLGGGLPGAGWSKQDLLTLTGKLDNGKVVLKGALAEGTLDGKRFTVKIGSGKPVILKKVVRQSPTLGASPPQGAIVLFDGSNLDEWDNAVMEPGNYLGVNPHGKHSGPRTKRVFKDFTLHLEFRTPFKPYARGQSRGNSGMYILDQYECQVLDSFGLPGYDNECGGIYKIARPRVNMCFPPLTWQTYDVEFKAARFDKEGKKTEKAVTTIVQNGVVIHDHLKLPQATPGGGRNDEVEGALFLQDHGNPVYYRNIWIVEND